MAPHSQTEDELFIDPLEHCFEQIGHKETFHHEHELIEHAFARLRKSKSLKDAKRLLLGAAIAGDGPVAVIVHGPSAVVDGGGPPRDRTGSGGCHDVDRKSVV